MSTIKIINDFEEEKQNTLNDEGVTDLVERVTTFVKFGETKRAERFTLFENLMSFVFDGDQWTKREFDERTEAKKESLVFNMSEDYVKRYMAKLFPRNPQTGVMEVGVKVTERDKTKKEKFEDEILKIYKYNNLAGILLEQGNNFLVGGAACLYYPQDDITKRATIISLDPKTVFLGWKFGKLVQFAFKEKFSDGTFHIHYWDLSKFVKIDEKNNVIFQRDNKFNFVPASWIPNSPKPHRREGIPLTLSLMAFDCEYNKTSSNFSDRITENTEPHIVLSSNSVSIDNIERGRKKKTKIAQGDSLTFMELKEGAEIINWLDKVAERFNKKTGIVSSGGTTKAGVSGKSLSFQFSDMMDLIGFMRIFWDTSFRELNNAILSYRFGLNLYDTDPVYQPFLQQDVSDRIDDTATMIDKGIISRADAIDDLRGVDNAGIKVEEILKEQEKFSRFDRQVNNRNNQD